MGSSVQPVGSILVEGGTQLLASSCQLIYLGLGFGLYFFFIDLRHMCGGVSGRGGPMGSGWRVFGRYQGKEWLGVRKGTLSLAMLQPGFPSWDSGLVLFI